MEETVLCNMKKKSLVASIICAVAMVATYAFLSPSEFLVTTLVGIYSLVMFLRLKGKTAMTKDIKNLVLFVNILMVCYNLAKLTMYSSFYSGWDLLASFITLTWHIVNVIYVYKLFRGKANLETKTYTIATIAQLVLMVAVAILSRQYWAWGNVAYAVMCFVFSMFIKEYAKISNGKDEYSKETLAVLTIDEDEDFKALELKKKRWKLAGHILLAVVIGVFMAVSEWFGCALVTAIIVTVAPLVYIYRLGNAINEPKGMLYISFFIPLVGMILYLIYVRNVKALGNACGKAALLGLLMLLIYVVTVGPFVFGGIVTATRALVAIL